MLNTLLYLKIVELRDIAKRLRISHLGKKLWLAKNIDSYLNNGVEIAADVIPDKVKAQRGISYPISEAAPMVYGAYKNDLRTREFFKSIIGPHFHFTVFGLDWLHDRWMNNITPTYGEFAKMWIDSYKISNDPKIEWAYIRFMQAHIGPRDEVHKAWQATRLEAIASVETKIREYLEQIQH